jgi:hypothetical protein
MTARADPDHPWGVDVPNPGSAAAIAHGCRCAVMDNAYGRGYMGGPGSVYGWVVTADCPLHGEPPPPPPAAV